MNDDFAANPLMPETPSNPLLERLRMPGETHTLPSKGLLYKNGELREDVKNGELHIFPMNAMEEILMRAPDKLFSGEAITDVFKRCIPQVLKPLDMFARDVDFLLVAIRKVAYGSEFEVEFSHDCEGAKTHSYMIQIDPFIANVKEIDPTKIGSTYGIELVNGQKVEVSPIRYRSVVDALQSIQLVQSSGVGLTVKQQQDMAIRTLLDVIVNVDDIVDKKFILEWLETISAGMAKTIQDKIEGGNNFGPEFSTIVRCKDCGAEIDVATPLNPMSFFIPS